MDGAPSRFNEGVVDAAVDLHLPPLNLPCNSLCFRASWDARVLVPEVSLSDDRRLFGNKPGGLD